MKRLATLSALGLLALCLAVLLGQSAGTRTAQDHEHAALFPPDQIKWTEGPPSLPRGARVAILEGDPAKEGPFVMRLRFPDGYRVPPHTHPKPERVTVLAGALKIAMGDRLERDAASTLPAGSFGTWPAGMKHTAWMEGETILQLHGVGPWEINYLNPADDPRKAGKAQGS